jgi:2-polyprenyl-3-methyl-5-hydroxy-6-metoxy-1,4-benzoquinol methylase
MSEFLRKNHWGKVYQKKKTKEVSWFQLNPKTSIELILSLNPEKEDSIIDIGGGDSLLADNLVEFGFKRIFVLDISSEALERSRDRLYNKREYLNWLHSDVTDFKTDLRFNIWHDRATFHFLTDSEDIKKYITAAEEFIKPNGYMILSTFSMRGPNKCSGLDVKQYSKESMIRTFENGFDFVESLDEVHTTPSSVKQNFIYCLLRRKE